MKSLLKFDADEGLRMIGYVTNHALGIRLNEGAVYINPKLTVERCTA